jgi:hypothetical protein
MLGEGQSDTEAAAFLQLVTEHALRWRTRSNGSSSSCSGITVRAQAALQAGPLQQEVAGGVRCRVVWYGTSSAAATGVRAFVQGTRAKQAQAPQHL